MDEPREYTQDELAYLQEAGRQQTQDDAVSKVATQSALVNAYQDIQGNSSREFYLAYEDFLTRTINGWRGMVEKEGQWTVGDARIMSDEMALFIARQMETVLGIPSRLSDLPEDRIELIAVNYGQIINGYIHVQAMKERFALKKDEDVSKTGTISIEAMQPVALQITVLIYAALRWAKNGGAQRFMNRSIISHETVSRIFADRDQKKEQSSDKKWVPNKLW